MVYQSFKYFLIRVGISFFILLTMGFSVLFFMHEVALPGVIVNDAVLKWFLIVLGCFFGFVVYSVFGEYQFHKAIEGIKNIDFREAGEEMVARFRKLLRFTESSYFLPKQARRLRKQVVLEYAGFLLNTGREDEEALNIYLKAYLQDPGQNSFRDILVTVLTQKEELTSLETDLLLIILKTNNYQDKEILHFLAAQFLDRNWYTSKTEAVFLHSLENKGPRSEEIIHFLLPRLLEKGRSDHLAISFYLKATDLVGSVPQEQMETFIGQSFLAGRFKVGDPDLHARCQSVFESLTPSRQEEIADSFENQKVSERWKRVRLFRPEDKGEINQLKVETGISPSGSVILRESASRISGGIGRRLKRVLFRFFDSLHWLGSLDVVYKLFIVGVLLVVVVGVTGVEWKSWFKGLTVPPEDSLPLPQQVLTPHVKIHTIQVAAVTSQKQAKNIVRELKRKKVEGVYVIKTERKNGGFWYKIRLGKFGSKEEAQQYASHMVDQKAIRNYFIISLGDGRKGTVSPQKSKVGKTP